MEEQLDRADLLKVAGLVTAGSALALGMPGRARATHGGTHTGVYVQAYVVGSGLPTLLVQAAAASVPVLAPGTPGVADLGPDPFTGIPGFGFDVDFGEAVVGNNSQKNKGRNPSWCFLTFTKGALNGFPPVNSGGQDAVRLEGTVTEAVDPANLGVPVKVNVISGFPIDPHHSVCVIRFFFGPFGPWNGRGLAVVNE